MRSWLGHRGISLLTSLYVSTVRGLEFIIASVSVISVLRFSPFKLEPCVFSSASRIVWAEHIWRSHMPPMCEAPGGFLCHLTQSVPLFRETGVRFPVGEPQLRFPGMHSFHLQCVPVPSILEMNWQLWTKSYKWSRMYLVGYSDLTCTRIDT